jgi:nitroreductase
MTRWRMLILILHNFAANIFLMIKKTKNRYNFNTLAQDRWSNRAFSPKSVDDNKLNSILEAASWAPSAFNEQPWRFVVGKGGDETHKKILETLVEWNQQWAASADVLVLNVAKRNFSHNGTPNQTCEYDLGQAVAFMALEAVNQGLFSHQMSGFDAKAAAEVFGIGPEYNVVSVMAIGHYGEADKLPDELRELEMAERKRKSLENMVFRGSFPEK